MTITTQVRINWPVHALSLLDHLTIAAGGDLARVKRVCYVPGDRDPFGDTFARYVLMNEPQGLRSALKITWGEKPEITSWYGPAPPALVVLTMDNGYGKGDREKNGVWLQANRFLPAAAEWLDIHNVSRERWWWEDESRQTFHPGTTPVQALWDDTIEREIWSSDDG